jgi:non-ribosomal peptide synthetase component F
MKTIFFLFLDAVIEQEMPMTGASMYWLDALHDCNLDRSLALPYDRYRLKDEHRTGRGISVSFDFGEDLSNHFLAYASSNNVTNEYLALAICYAFLFKLTNGERDLCIGINTDGRYKDELKTVIGLFENTIPLRCQLNPHWSFHQLIDYICNIISSSMKYCYFPLQRLLAQHPNSTKPAFLDTSFKFRSNDNDKKKKKVMIGDASLHPMSIPVKRDKDEIMSKFDFALIFQHDLKINQLSCAINASCDLFNEATIDKIGQRFHSMLYQLFYFIANDQMTKPMYELLLILPNERLLMQSINNTEVSFPSVSCIHHEFICQVRKHPQKLAVELDNQSLTYAELLHYVELLAIYLLNQFVLIPEEIISQCVERSLSMVRDC